MKNKKHRWLLVFVLFILVIAAGCVGWLFLRNQNSSKASNDETVVKKNVRILTSKMEKDQLPVKVTNDTLVFEKNPKYKKGQVIVAGIIEGAEYGFIRRVTDIEHEGDTYTFYECVRKTL